MNVIVTCPEVNDKHGTGILIIRIFDDSSDIVSIRSRNYYGGQQDFGARALLCRCTGLSRAEIREKLLKILDGINVERVLCILYSPEEILISLLLKELFASKVCTYIMDDQNIYKDEDATSDKDAISDALMRELLEKSDLRLAISPELREAYEHKYGLKFWILPGLVPAEAIEYNVLDASEYRLFTQTRRGILVGNIWAQRWLESLREAVRGSDVVIDWYGRPESAALSYDKDELEQDGLHLKGLIPEPDLIKVLRSYPYSIYPTGCTDETDDRPAIANLSLPSRLSLILAAAHTPIIIIGSPETAAAHFVERFGVGLTCGYDPASFRKAVDYVCRPDVQQKMRHNAVKIAHSLSAEAAGEWIWQSLEKGAPYDLRFEKLMTGHHHNASTV